MNRSDEIVNFLKYAKNYYQNNEIKMNNIYALLETYYLSNKEFHISYANLFTNWQNNFSNIPNIKVFQSPLQKGFLQFKNMQNNNSTADFIKLYINVDPKHVESVVNLIFNYTAQKNMKQCSKVSDVARSDQIVLRLVDPNDAKDIINYINNNNYIKQYLRPTNPFVERIGRVGVSYDRRLSYNSIVATLAASYLNTKTNINDITIQDFINYINLYLNNPLKIEETEVFSKATTRLRGQNYNNIEDIIANFYEVIDLIKLSCQGDINLDEYLQKFNSSIVNRQYLINYVNTCIKKKEEDEPTVDILKAISVNNYVIHALAKYGDIQVVISLLKNFEEGKLNAITREYNLRDEFAQIKINEFKQIVNNNINNFVININNSFRYMKQSDKYNLIQEAIKTTLNKYGIRQAIGSLQAALNGDYSKITNGNTFLRDKMKISISLSDLNSFVEYAMNYFNLSEERNNMNLENLIYCIEQTDKNIYENNTNVLK